MFFGGWLFIVDSVDITNSGLLYPCGEPVPWHSGLTLTPFCPTGDIIFEQGNKLGILIRFNYDYYGIWQSTRFFNSDVVSFIMGVFGLMIIGGGFSELFSKDSEELEEEDRK
jgi:hypothetical protein